MLESQQSSPSRDGSTKPSISVAKRTNYQYWLNHTRTSEIDKRAPFYPCSHEGSCEDARCRCFRGEITCEKSCACDQSCGRRFRGCSCVKTGRSVCFGKAICDCWQLNRECDPDLCGSCGATEVLDPMNKNDHRILHGRCGNVGLQRNVARRTLVGQSQIAGFGLYAGEAFKKNEFIGEYKGEVLATGESDRRGTVYHYRATNYLFKLNKGTARALTTTRAWWLKLLCRTRSRQHSCRE